VIKAYIASYTYAAVLHDLLLLLLLLLFYTLGSKDPKG